MRILIVEDDPTSRMVLTRYLEPLGACEAVGDGHEAVAAVGRALLRNEPFDLICLDIMMPTMSGQEALSNIRQLENQRGVLPGYGAKVIMITAKADKDNIFQAFDHQCEIYLVKPVMRDKLYAQLKKLGLLAA